MKLKGNSRPAKSQRQEAWRTVARFLDSAISRMPIHSIVARYCHSATNDEMMARIHRYVKNLKSYVGDAIYRKRDHFEVRVSLGFMDDRMDFYVYVGLEPDDLNFGEWRIVSLRVGRYPTWYIQKTVFVVKTEFHFFKDEDIFFEGHGL